MRFGVLGPLAVWADDGMSVAIPGAKVRALLADLLIHRGEVMSADRLIDDLWGEEAPGNPAGALQAKVSQLRRVLGQAEPGGRALIVSRSPGYLLHVDPDAVDASRFAALAARARATGEARAAAALLGEALALWRGSALADFSNDHFARAAINRLEEQRLAALEDDAEARLTLGEHGVLVGELGSLLTLYPLRERLRAAHMRTLYRAGRQAEALDSYGQLRDCLREELGLDPSPELVRLHQAILVQDPDLDAVLPRAPAARVRTNLPAPRTSLVGRTHAVAEVRRLLDAGRLVTLTGPGGVGKTRLALETAAQLVETMPDGAWVVELAALERSHRPEMAGSLTEVVATVLGIRDDTTLALGPTGKRADPTDRLAGALQAKQLLLVLDNCERVIDPVAKLVALLLRGAPGLRIIATSREPLRLDGELLWPVPPLELPDPAVRADIERLAQSSAIQLFVARAAAASPGFVLGADNGAAIAVICQRLDGLPLALELAAARVRALGVPQLAARLDDRFRLLAAGRRDAPARQQTLRALIDWSWELLSVPERAVLRRLGVHADGCELAAAEVVCAADGVAGADVLDLLARLVDRSLVVVADNASGPRYRLLETVAAYCLQRLHEAGESERTRHRHAHWYVDLAERAAAHLRSHNQREWLQRLDVETANLRVALEFAVQFNDAALALRLTNAMGWYWFLRGRHREAHQSLSRALATGGETPVATRANALALQSALTFLERTGTDPVEQSRTVLDLYDRLDEPAARARAKWLLGLIMAGSGELSTAERLVREALSSLRRLGDRWDLAAALSVRAWQALARGELADARRDIEESAALFRALGDRWGQVRTVDLLGVLAEIAGDHERAARLHHDGLRMAEELQLWPVATTQLARLGRLASLAGNYPAADEFHEQALRLAHEQSYEPGVAFASLGLGLGARRQGRFERAAAYLRDALDWNRRTGYEPGTALALAELGFVAEQRGDAEAARTLHLEGLAAARVTGDPRAVALALEGLAGAAALADHHRQAALLLGAATTARESVGAPLPPAERGDVDRITARARTALGESAFATTFDRGKHMSLTECLPEHPDPSSAAEPSEPGTRKVGRCAPPLWVVL